MYTFANNYTAVVCTQGYGIKGFGYQLPDIYKHIPHHQFSLSEAFLYSLSLNGRCVSGTCFSRDSNCLEIYVTIEGGRDTRATSG